MKTFRKRLLPLLLTVSMLLALMPITATTVSASTPATDENLVSTHHMYTKDWDFKQTTGELFGVVDLSSAPKGAWLSFEYDATNLPDNPASTRPDDHCFAFYIDYQIKASDWSSLLETDSKYSYENIQVSRKYEYNGQQYYDAKGGAREETGTWCFTVPNGSKGSFSVRLYDKSGNAVETNTIKYIRIRQERWQGNGSSRVCLVSKIGYAMKVTTPPTGMDIPYDNGYTYAVDGSGNVSCDSQENTYRHNFHYSDTSIVPDDSRLAVYFDTTEMEVYKTASSAAAEGVTAADLNCFAIADFQVYDGTLGQWKSIKDYIGGEAGYQTNMTTVFTREENGEMVTRTVVGKNYNYNWNTKSWNEGASSWMFTLPSDARGYVIFTFTKPGTIRNLWGCKPSGTNEYSGAAFGKKFYFGNAGYLPPNTALAATEGLDIVRSDEDDYTVTVDADKEIKAGTLLVYNTSNGKLATMKRTGYPGTNDQDLDSNSFNNTTEFTFNLAAKQDVVVKAEYYDTSSTTPNMGLLGYQTKDEKIRIQYRANVKWDSDAGKYYMNCGGAKKYVESFGMLMATEKMKNTYGLTLEAVETSGGKVKMADFVVRRNRNDACAAWHDVCITYTGLNTEAKQKTQIYTTWFVKFEGETTVHYGEEVHRSYSEIEAIKNANA